MQAEHTHSSTPLPGAVGRSRNPSPNTHPQRAPVPGVAWCKRSTHTAQHPSQEWRGAAEDRAQTHTPTARTRARSGWVQAEHAHSRTPHPGVAGHSRNPSSNTHTHTAHPCQEWLDASRAHTRPNSPARSGGAQLKPEPKHTHPHRAPVPGVAGCKRSTHTAQHPSQECRGAAETRAQAHTPTPRTRARSGWVQAEHTHSPTPGPGVAGRSRNPSSNTHTDGVNPCQEWLGASGARTQPNTPARSRGAQPKPEPKHTDPHRAPVPGVAGRSRNRSPNTHTHTAHPCQEWLGASGARTQPNTPARSGGAQPKPEPKHTHPHRAPVPGVAGCKRSTHTAQHPSQECRGAAETRAQTHTPTPRIRARSG